MSDATWLPNLVGGTSIWKLAIDLNETKFFDGRLLVPETEGSESLPVTVRWDLTGLIPLGEARTAHPDESAAAIKDFQACLERVAKVFATPNSGFDKYKDAFTVPSLEADDGASYFYSAAKKKLFVINWGASPRSMGGKAEYVFGFADWAKEWRPPAAIAGAAAAAAATVAALKSDAPAAAAAAPAKDEKKEGKKDEKKEKGRPWWLWPLFGLVVIILVLLALFLLRACEEQKLANGADAALDAPAEGASSADGAAAGEAGAEAGAADASDDASAQGDAGDASTDGGDAGALADGGDAGRDGGRRDGGPASDDDDDDDGPTGSSGGVGSSGGGGPVVVKVFPGGGTKTSVHRKHYSDDAVAWRVSGATAKVSRTEDSGKRFDVWLAPGQTFEGVKVEWQDKAGKWHVH